MFASDGAILEQISLNYTHFFICAWVALTNIYKKKALILLMHT